MEQEQQDLMQELKLRRAEQEPMRRYSKRLMNVVEYLGTTGTAQAEW